MLQTVLHSPSKTRYAFHELDDFRNMFEDLMEVIYKDEDE